MKIALIEDRIGRLEKFVEFDIHNCRNVSIITGLEFDSLINSLETKVTDELDKYDCIASHRSALSNEIRETIKEYCKKQNKPLIFFSGGISSAVFKDIDFQFLHINAKDFYSSKLRLFIENAVHTDNINLLILQFGEKWKLSLFLNLRNHMAVSLNKQKLKNEKPDINIEQSELIKRVRDLQINNLIKSDLINEKTDKIWSGNDFTSIDTNDIKNILITINQLINKML